MYTGVYAYTIFSLLFLIKAKDNINYYLFAWAHVIDATYVNRRVGAMQPYAENELNRYLVHALEQPPIPLVWFSL